MIDTKLVQQLLETARAVTPLAALRATAFDPRQHSSEESLVVRARVAARLSDGSFRVMVDGKAHRLALAPDVQPGEWVELRVLPRANEPAGVRIPSTETTETLSSAGQVLARVLAQPRGETPRQAEPVVSVPPSRPEELAEPLARAVERSGVFYESHQARWIDGEYPLQRLLQEPQAGLNPPQRRPHDTSPAGAPRPATANESAAAAEKPVLVALPPPASARGSESKEMPERLATAPVVTSSADPEPADLAAAQTVPKEALPLVRQQLDTLETRQLTWLGDIWPGQSMHWEISEEPEHAREAEEASRWRSRFELSLPLLGSVGADIQLNGVQLRMRFTAEDSATAAAMRSAAEELTQALQACGLQVAACAIDCHEDAS